MEYFSSLILDFADYIFGFTKFCMHMERLYKNLPIEIGCPYLERIVDARNISITTACPVSWIPPGTIFSWPIPSLNNNTTISWNTYVI